MVISAHCQLSTDTWGIDSTLRRRDFYPQPHPIAWLSHQLERPVLNDTTTSTITRYPTSLFRDS